MTADGILGLCAPRAKIPKRNLVEGVLIRACNKRERYIDKNRSFSLATCRFEPIQANNLNVDINAHRKAMMTLNSISAVAPQLISGVITLGTLSAFCYALFVLPSWVKKLKTWQKYCTSHSRFSTEAGQGQYLWLEDPWSSACEIHFFATIPMSDLT